MSTTPTATVLSVAALRSGCVGVTPLTARLEVWHHELCADSDQLTALVVEQGSPVNVLDVSALGRNAAELTEVAERLGVRFRVFLARKANKALAFVSEARRLGHGIDVASERELRQVLDARVPATDIILTAAVKPRALLELAVDVGVTIALDNADEFLLLCEVVGESSREVRVAIRIAAELGEGRSPTRFGFALDEVPALAKACAAVGIVVHGVHFHLDGYLANDRIIALGQALNLTDELRELGCPIEFVDMGGGIPMSYLDSPEEWRAFWDRHRAGLLEPTAGLTFNGHGLGLHAHEGAVLGSPNVYPYHQSLIRGAWLEEVLRATVPDTQVSVAAAFSARDLELRCEPGRSMLDGCGATVARVEFRKRRADGTWLIGLAMNRTQVRSTSDDFLVDPLLVRGAATSAATAHAPEPIEGYLVGAYCIERELLTWRRLRFPHGVAVGDLVVFPNTAGYLMHIVESGSHQIPLARNVVRGTDGATTLDAIDCA